MAMDISNRTVKYCGRPWDFIRKADWLSSGGQDQRDLIPWENRTWFLSLQANIRQVEQEFDGGVAVRTLSAPPRGAAELTRDEVDEAFTIAEETDCTLAEAAIAVVGPDAFSKDYIQEVMKYRTCWKPVARRPVPEDQVVGDIEWEDPRAKTTKKKASKKKASKKKKAVMQPVGFPEESIPQE